MSTAFRRSRTGLYVPRGGAPAATYFDAVMADSPLAYYRLGETSGLTVVDSSGNGRDGIYSTAKTPVTGLLTGDSDGGSAQRGGATSAAWMDVAAITIECLIQPAVANNNAGIISRFLGVNWLLWFNVSSQIAVRFYNTSGSQVDLAWSTTPTTGTTYHVAATYQSGQARLYINGTQVASSTSLTGSLAANSSDLEIRTYQGFFDSNAVMDEVAYYSGELSAGRIAAHAALV